MNDDLADLAAARAGRAKAEQQRKTTNSDGDGALIGDILPPELRGYDLTEDGVAQAFAFRHGNDLRYCHGPNRALASLGRQSLESRMDTARL